MIQESRIVGQLRVIAARLTVDLELQKDLTQEMLIHFTRREAELPRRTPSWYLQSCWFHANKYLNQGRSVDSLKRRNNLVPLGQPDDDGDDCYDFCQDVADPIDLSSELITRDIVVLLLPQLTDTQRQILFLLMHDFGLREIGRELNISHPMVIRHRKKIARVASAVLADANGIDSRNRADRNCAALVGNLR